MMKYTVLTHLLSISTYIMYVSTYVYLSNETYNWIFSIPDWSNYVHQNDVPDERDNETKRFVVYVSLILLIYVNSNNYYLKDNLTEVYNFRLKEYEISDLVADRSPTDSEETLSCISIVSDFNRSFK